ncbi:MAG: Uma2 family endonuclease [Candidatus Cybelea sp.]
MIARVPLVASDADILRISAENPGWRIERDANGALIMTPPTGIETSKRNALLTHMIFNWAEPHGYVAFDSNGGFRLADTSIVAPDAALVSGDRWASLSAEQRDGFFPGAPAVAVELCSHSDTPSLLQAKLERMRQAGTEYVVLVDPYRGIIWTDGAAPADFHLDFHQLLK